MENGKEQPRLRSEEVQDILTAVPHWMILWGNSIILILILLFMFLSWLIKYPDVILAEAQITSQNPPQKEYAKTTGKIDTILVKDHQVINNNQILAMIENGAELKDVMEIKKYIDSIQWEENNLEFPINTIPVFSLGEIAPAYTAFEKNYIDFALNKNLKPYSNQKDANKLSISELNYRLEKFYEQKEISSRSYDFSKKDIERTEILFNKGVISQQEYESKQISFLQDQRDLESIEVSISQIKHSINDAFKTSKETDINSQMEDIRLYKNVILSLNQLKQVVRDWELKYLLKSNFPGQVSFMGVLNKNQTVNQGDLLFTIVPQNKENYIAKILAPVQNSGKIEKGQEVNINLFNYPETEYGLLKGRVHSMSAIPNAEGFYLIDVILNNKLLTSYNIKIPFRNEMTGRAEIITEDLRLIERFFYKLKKIFKD